MKLTVAAVYDLKSESYLQPIFVPNKATAERAFSNSVNGRESDISQNPEDFIMYHIGEYDDESGLLTPLQPPAHIADAIKLKRINDAV